MQRQVATLVGLGGELGVEEEAELLLLGLQPLHHRPVQRILPHRPRANSLVGSDGGLHAQRRARLDRLLCLGGVGGGGGGLVVAAGGAAERNHRRRLGLAIGRRRRRRRR